MVAFLVRRLKFVNFPLGAFLLLLFMVVLLYGRINGFIIIYVIWCTSILCDEMTSATVLRIYYNVNNGTKRRVDDILPIQKQMFYSVFCQKDTNLYLNTVCMLLVSHFFHLHSIMWPIPIFHSNKIKFAVSWLLWKFNKINTKP